MDEQQRILHFVERIGLGLEEEGMPRMAGRVLGWLLICEPAAQSSAQLVEVLNASKGSISTNTRLLMRAGLIERVAVPGERSAYFQSRPHAIDLIMDQQVERLRAWRLLYEEGLALELSAGSRQNLEDMRDFYAFMEAELPAMLERWKAHKAGAAGD